MPPEGGPAPQPSLGEEAVRLARRTVERIVGAPGEARAVADPHDLPPEFDERRGVFVTLEQFPSGDLRGCVGFPVPVLPLREGIPQAAIAAAREDPRFPPVTARELPRLTVEVSLLSVPEPVAAADRDRLPEMIRVGRDGLIVDGFGSSGLLLPQVAPDQGWNARQFLEGTCEKAGLPPDAWRSPEVRIRRFESDVYGERTPRGAIEVRPH
ncbi:MAG TPA: TIGR00296 family protein [Thermoplasmata archaeon]|nr:TIGR00296 family protein [Thermoplasmata archaeon]